MQFEGKVQSVRFGFKGSVHPNYKKIVCTTSLFHLLLSVQSDSFGFSCIGFDISIYVPIQWREERICLGVLAL